jgi:hypothetical protein
VAYQVNPYQFAASGSTSNSKAGSFQLGTLTVGHTVDLTFPFDCKFLMLHGNGMETAAGQAHSTVNMKQCIGWATGTSSRRAVAYQVDDAADPMSTDRKHSDTCVYCVLGTTGLDAGAIDINSWSFSAGVTTIQLIVDVAFSFNYRIFYWGVGGSSVEAGLTTHQEPGATGDQGLTVGVSGANLFLFMGAHGASAPTGTHASDTTASALQFFGACDNAGGAAVWCGGSEDAIGTSDCSCYSRAGQVIAMMPGDPNTLTARATFVSVSGTTLTLNWAERAATRYFFVAALKVPSASVAGVTMPLGHPQSIAHSTSFKPTGGLVFSRANAEDADDTPSGNYALSIGQYGGDLSGAGNEGCWANREADNSASAQADNSAIDVSNHIHISATSSGVQQTFEVSSRTGSGVTYGTTDGSAVNVLLCSVAVA